MSLSTYGLTTNNPESSERLAEKIGKKLRGGEVIELISDLGGGKTTFVRGLARGFGSNDKVASPTFTISRIYAAGKKQLYHFDFYRLNEAGLIAHELSDILGDSSAVVVIEWGKVIRHALPDQRLTIKIDHAGDSSRELTISYPKALAYLIEDLWEPISYLIPVLPPKLAESYQ